MSERERAANSFIRLQGMYDKARLVKTELQRVHPHARKLILVDKQLVYVAFNGEFGIAGISIEDQGEFPIDNKRRHVVISQRDEQSLSSGVIDEEYVKGGNLPAEGRVFIIDDLIQDPIFYVKLLSDQRLRAIKPGELDEFKKLLEKVHAATLIANESGW